MKKDVIYIDTEDDITLIIEKIKAAASPIIALVPPKRVGVLQSSVNLRLLQRAAENSDKRVVLITSDKALSALASGLAIPIAKNLQSKPETGSLDEPESEESNVIYGEDHTAPVQAAALVKTPEPSKVPKQAPEKSEPEEEVISDNESEEVLEGINVDGETIESVETEVLPKKRSGDKGSYASIPNFSAFRKKLFLFSGLGVLVVGFLVWAIFFAPQASIAITAKTQVVNISKTLTLKPSAQLDASQAVAPALTQQVKKTVSVDFTPTGEQNVGEKATGTVKIKTDAATILISGLTVPSGTIVKSSGGSTYATTKAAVFAKGDAGALSGVVVDVVATAAGAQYNGATGTATTSAAGVTSVSFVQSPAGGTDKKVTVVTEGDVTKATSQLQAQDSNAIKTELVKLFTPDQIVINEAFTVEPGAATSTPAVGQEATVAKLTQETTYTLLGVKKADLKAVYDTYLAASLKGSDSQKVYASGEDTTQFSEFLKTEGGYSVKAVANAQVGPNIDSAKVASDARGLMVGEVRQTLSSIQGVSSVDVSLTPFWVNRVPNDTARIKVTFVLKND